MDLYEDNVFCQVVSSRPPRDARIYRVRVLSYKRLSREPYSIKDQYY